MKITNAMQISDFEREIGKRIARYRIDGNLSQKELADKAGIGLVTLIRLESGESINTRTLYKVLKALSVLENMEILLPDADFRPIDYLRYTKKAPQRVSKKKGVKDASYRETVGKRHRSNSS